MNLNYSKNKVTVGALNNILPPLTDPVAANGRMEGTGPRRTASGYGENIIFALFSCTTIFDQAALKITDQDALIPLHFKTLLQSGIVKKFRSTELVPHRDITDFRESLRKLKEFQGAEGFINTLFEHALQLPPFLQYSNNTAEYIHALSLPRKLNSFQTSSSTSLTIQDVLESSSIQLKLKSMPNPALIIQLPRDNSGFISNGHKKIIPNLKINLKKIINSGDGLTCGCRQPATMICTTCREIVACNECISRKIATHNYDFKHAFRMGEIIPTLCDLDLISIICYTEGHFTTVVKCGEGEAWLHYDSSVSVIENIPNGSRILKAAANENSSQYDRDYVHPKLSRILSDALFYIYAPCIPNNAVLTNGLASLPSTPLNHAYSTLNTASSILNLEETTKSAYDDIKRNYMFKHTLLDIIRSPVEVYVLSCGSKRHVDPRTCAIRSEREQTKQKEGAGANSAEPQPTRYIPNQGARYDNTAEPVPVKKPKFNPPVTTTAAMHNDAKRDTFRIPPDNTFSGVTRPFQNARHENTQRSYSVSPGLEKLDRQPFRADKDKVTQRPTSHQPLQKEKIPKSQLQDAIPLGLMTSFPYVTERNIRDVCGTKGIKLLQNSCYVDTAFVSFFFFTDVLDDLVFLIKETDDQLTREMKVDLLKIVNMLRSSKVVGGDVVMRFRQKLVQEGKYTKKLVGSFMDPEEFMFILFKRALQLPPFIHYASGATDFLHQIFLPVSQTNKRLATVQELFIQSMNYNGNLRLAERPSPALIILLPRANGKLMGLKYILPNLTLDLIRVMNATKTCMDCQGPASFVCSICNNDKMATCKQKICIQYSTLLHRKMSHAHDPKFTMISQPSPEDTQMKLIAVVCVATFHYTAFARCGNEWLFYDSMIPTITKVQGLNNFLSKQEQIHNEGKKIKKPDLNFIRMLKDAQYCIYVPVVNSHRRGARQGTIV